MATSDEEKWLQEGIAALKAGEGEKARALLLKVVEVNEENEQAWLWLTGTAETDEERRICLENVLTLNPNNRVAQKGLARLSERSSSQPAQDGAAQAAAVESAMDKENEVRSGAVSVSPASAILYPKQQTEGQDRPIVFEKTKAPDITYKAASSFDDIWTRDVDICAYCAQELAYDENRCPGCGRNLIAKRYRYPNPSTNLYVFWVILIGLGLLFLVQAVYASAVERNAGAAVLATVATIALLVLSGGVYFRRFWAYAAAIALLSAMLFIGVISLLTPIDLAGLSLEQVDPAIANVTGPLVTGIGMALKLIQAVTIVLALAYALFRIAPDFERSQDRQVAAVTKGLSDSGSYHLAARRLAQTGMWASAVLHWQRAAAKEPNQVTYQRHLGLAYAQLGFYERSLDVLQSAYKSANNPAVQTELKQLINSVERRMTQLKDNNG